MTVLLPDPSPDVERLLIELLRRAPAWRKLEMVAQLNDMARTLALSGLRQRHPDATPEELHRRLADLLLGTELAEFAPSNAAVRCDAERIIHDCPNRSA